MGRQPFGLASPAAFLRPRGHEVMCLDLSRQRLQEAEIARAGLIAFFVPMHTAARLAIAALPRIQQLNPAAHICFYGLYAPLNEPYLRELGAGSVLGGEFEEALVRLAGRLAGYSTQLAAPEPAPASSDTISLSRLTFPTPDRAGLPPLKNYSHVILPSGEHRVTGYTEASRGCKHLCRHCPIVPVYNGVFRVVDREAVLADIRQQVAAGARHITFGDPDFFNGPGHVLPIVESLHREFPELTYDVTIKVEHLLKEQKLLPTLRDTGCLFVTSAVESLDDAVLEKLAKGHTRADFFEVLKLFRALGMNLLPTFVPFTPWTTAENYLDLLQVLRDEELVANVSPIQLGIRLLIPAGSRLLELPDIAALVGKFDPRSLAHPWRHPEPKMDALCEEVLRLVASGERFHKSRPAIFDQTYRAARDAAGLQAEFAPLPVPVASAAAPYLNEPWYC